MLERNMACLQKNVQQRKGFGRGSYREKKGTNYVKNRRSKSEGRILEQKKSVQEK